MATSELDAVVDRFIRLVKTADVWTDELSQAHASLCAALGVVRDPPTKTYAAAREFAARLAEARQARDAARKQADVEFLEALEAGDAAPKPRPRKSRKGSA